MDIWVLMKPEWPPAGRLQDCCGAPSVPPGTAEQTAVWLWVVAPSASPGVLACLLLSPTRLDTVLGGTANLLAMTGGQEAARKDEL